VFPPQIQRSCHTAPLLAAPAFGVLSGEDSLVRELRELNRDMVRSSDRRPKDTGLSLGEIARQSVAEAERHAIRLALQATHGNKSEAARLLRVDYKTLHLKVKRYGIDTREFRVS
jgi:DNA-binding NtrC family response regulator